MVWVTEKKKKLLLLLLTDMHGFKKKKKNRLPAVTRGSYETGVVGRDCLNCQRMQERRAACMPGQQMISMIFFFLTQEKTNVITLLK